MIGWRRDRVIDGSESMGLRTIRELREARGWSQFELGTRLGVTPNTVYNWERGRNEPRVTQLRALAQAFGVAMEEIAVNDRDRETIEKIAA